MTDPSSIDVQTRVINALIDHWPLVLGLGALARWGFPWALREHGHQAFTSEKGRDALHAGMTAFFNNGGGEKVREIVRTENAVQSAVHKDEIRSAIKDHEEVEERRFRERMDAFRDDFKQEITGEFDLRVEPSPRRRATPRRRGRTR